jgi:hypothetical protein
VNPTASDVFQAALCLGQPQLVVGSEPIGVKALHQEVS